jgi:hypothetical protein
LLIIYLNLCLDCEKWICMFTAIWLPFLGPWHERLKCDLSCSLALSSVATAGQSSRTLSKSSNTLRYAYFCLTNMYDALTNILVYSPRPVWILLVATRLISSWFPNIPSLLTGKRFVFKRIHPKCLVVPCPEGELV